MSDKTRFLFIPEDEMPDEVMVGSIARSRADDMVRFVPERTCDGCAYIDFQDKYDMPCEACIRNTDYLEDYYKAEL